MHKRLYLLCPTDGLESIINDTFKYENYYYTSLGNSFVFDSKTLHWIKDFITKNHITDIQFILCRDNPVVLDALGDQSFSMLNGIHTIYNEITEQNIRSRVISQSRNSKFSVISYYLNTKIAKLQLELNALLDAPIQIGGKIYNRHQNTFINIYSNLVCLDKYHLN